MDSDQLKILSSKETERDGKWLLYWKTTTLTSTSTSYTVTHSLKALECTPSGFQMDGNRFLYDNTDYRVEFRTEGDECYWKASFAIKLI